MIDFKDWKKIEENAKSCTLEHPKGHTIKIAMGALPKIQREQIKGLELSKGGRVDEMMTPDDSLASGKGGTSEQGKAVREKTKEAKHEAREEARGRAEMERHNKPKMKGLARGGEVQMFADDPDLVEQQDDAPQNGPPSAQQQAPMNHAPITIINAPQAAPPAAQPAPAMPAPPAPQQKPPGVVDTGVPIPEPMKVQSDLHPNGTMNPVAVNQNTERAAQEQAKISAAESQARSANEAQYTGAQQEKIKEYQDAYQDVKAHVDDFSDHFRKAVKDISPDHYMENMSTPQKVSTAIGLFLGGLSTPFGGHNFAMDFLNKQIDRDIDSQKTKAEGEKNILGAYKDLYHDDVAAINMAKATQLDIYTHNIMKIAADMNTPGSAQRAQEWINATVPERQKLLQEAAVRLTDLPGGEHAGPTNGAAAPKTSGQEGAPEGQKQGVYRLLTPDAESKFRSFLYKPKFKEYAPQLQEQMQQAQQIEKVLNGPKNDGIGGLRDTMKKMHEYAKASGLYGHVKREGKEAIGMLPVVGHAGAGAVNVIPQTDNEKRYNLMKTNLVNELGTAFHGLVPVHDLEAIVNASAPAYRDDDNMVTDKTDAIANSVLKKAKTNLLDTAGMRVK